jgi:hypothetical protein
MPKEYVKIGIAHAVTAVALFLADNLDFETFSDRFLYSFVI